MEICAIEREYALTLLPKRKNDGHKGDFGKVLILGGSVGYTGAPMLASRAALRSGCGLVFVGVPECVYPIVASNSCEAMVRPLSSAGGKLTMSALDEVLALADRCDRILIGCGLGRSEESDELVRCVLRETDRLVVLDADGINALSGHIDCLRERAEGATILTPHEGEFLRIGGDFVNMGREEGTSAFARAYGCVLVRKGPITLVADEQGNIRRSSTGNCGMAKGGSGDVLAGMIVSLWAQGMSARDASAAGVWLHARAGDIAAEELTQYAMTPGDMIDRLPCAFREIV